MASSSHYRQCKLRSSTHVMITWIEERFAREGKKLHVLDDEGEAEEGVWVVETVGARQSAEYVREHQVDHLKWRANVDI
jgi:hypothetical protein